MFRIILLFATFILRDIQCRSIFMPYNSIISSGGQHGHRSDNVLVREKKSILSELEAPFHPAHSTGNVIPQPLQQLMHPHTLSHVSLPMLQYPQHLHQHHHSDLMPLSNDQLQMKLREIFDYSSENSFSKEAPFQPIQPNLPIPSIAPNSSPYNSPYQKYASSSCGSNLVFGCQPQVKTVPCYGQSSYGFPPSYSPAPVYTYSSRTTGPTPYFVSTPNDASLDLYAKPGPPYLPEPNVASALPISRDKYQYTISNHNDEQRKDSRPESSSVEKKTETEDTTEISYDATTQKVVLNAESEEQIRKLSEKINNHVENLERFKEMAAKKLRAALKQSNVTDEFEEIHKYLNLSPSFRKRHLLTDPNANSFLTNFGS